MGMAPFMTKALFPDWRVTGASEEPEEKLDGASAVITAL